MDMKPICLSIRQENGIDYSPVIPYDPDENFPELEAIKISNKKNYVYRSIRQCFIDLEMDKKNIGTSEWSPLSEIISPGYTVVIKPNLVLHSSKDEMQEYLTTHPSVLRPIVDYCWKAMKGSGLVVVGDACSSEADFDLLVERLGLKQMIDVLKQRGVNVELRDFRSVKVMTENGIWVGEQEVAFEQPQSQVINLGKNSLFAIDKYKHVDIHGAGYDIKSTMRHHTGDIQEYRVSKTVLSANVVISVPKLKTHRKAGLTCCLKNLVGINVDKNYLPHFTMGSKNMGGDEMPVIDHKNIKRVKFYNLIRKYIIGYSWKLIGKPGVRMLRLLKDRETKFTEINMNAKKQVTDSLKKSSENTDLARWLHNKLSGQSVAAGAWSGNETICRMILDLNRIFLCCDREGHLRSKTDRNIFYIVDGISMGMGNGPTSPIPVKAGLVAAGWNGYMIDTKIVGLFGVDPDSITLYKMAKGCPWLFSNAEGKCLINGKSIAESSRLPIELIPPDGWSFRKKSTLPEES
ncbi:DUF362 domain-containing protein [Desulfitobacterium sp. Sab5]|uniref:DUF362 domain-containing protein n=1 Tax=Desulfitobacterium nosdiversum TaxID=3375356 RepID=UPI003CECA67E